jgi:hypothetical protein
MIFSTAVRDLIDRWSNGCFPFKIDAYQLPIGQNERNSDGCVITHAEDLKALDTQAYAPGWSASKYDSTLLIPITSQCDTGGTSGSHTLSASGVEVTFRSIFTGIRGAYFNTPCSGWTCPISRYLHRTIIHELIHNVGMGRHSNAYVCREEPTNPLQCPIGEYGDKYDVMGSSSEPFGFGLNAGARYLFGWLGGDEVALAHTEDRYTLQPLDGSKPGLKRAAYVPAADMWIEWHAADSPHWGPESSPENARGLVLHTGTTLVDASRQLCRTPKEVAKDGVRRTPLHGMPSARGPRTPAVHAASALMHQIPRF